MFGLSRKAPAKNPEQALGKTVGATAERVAEQWLCAKGLKSLERQVACRFGEIDLVMRDKGSVVLVEVKYREASLQAAVDSVTMAKRRKLGLAAKWLYGQRPEWQQLAWRFDVLAVSGDLSAPEVRWLTSAFEIE